MLLNQLKEKYKILKEMEDTDDGIFEFKNHLLQSDDESILEFHISILQDYDNEYLWRDIFAFFSERKNKETVGDYLFEKINGIQMSDRLKADLIQILGHLRYGKAIDICKKYYNSKVEELRYRSIIVLGWVGNKDELKILNERLNNDESETLRGYSATAMRQIYFNHPETKTEIQRYLKFAISNESNTETINLIVIVLQDLLDTNFGINESKYGDISGNTANAKLAAINYLNKMNI